MGVPKFYRWLSERYPRINQPLHCPVTAETRRRHFGDDSEDIDDKDDSDDDAVYKYKTCVLPEFDRMYVDMNGIIHCCSHNNVGEWLSQESKSSLASEKELAAAKTSSGDAKDPDGTVELGTDSDDSQSVGRKKMLITEEEIFRNICFYLDRLVTDIVRPKDVLYLAVDGVAPRAKLNQQRSRRYRTGKELELDIRKMPLEEIQEGRFVGTFQSQDTDYDAAITASAAGTEDDDEEDVNVDGKGIAFRTSNQITPGTAFLERCCWHIADFVQKRISEDKDDGVWANLKGGVFFSPADVPGEGEHKIMQFMREQQDLPDYSPNLRHCIVGQDADLIMLGLTTHEPHMCLLREEVIFSMPRKRASFNDYIEKRKRRAQRRRQGQVQQTDAIEKQDDETDLFWKTCLESYYAKTSFELLHMSVLRDYLRMEFQTQSDVDLERTVDDFVFLTFFVGNDFLPHLPALDIGDEAFDLLFYAYRQELRRGRATIAYLTHAGEIVSGQLLESFLTVLGGFETLYWENKKKKEQIFGTPDEGEEKDITDAKEEHDRNQYGTMLLETMSAAQEKNDFDTEDGDAGFTNYHDDDEDDVDDGFSPVLSSGEMPSVASLTEMLRTTQLKSAASTPTTDEDDTEREGIFSRLGHLLQKSIRPFEAEKDSSSSALQHLDATLLGEHFVTDLKGRYYYDKFQFTPFDAVKHVALRKAYVEGLVWNLQYYYKGCPSWEWYYPYHYGPMLSDLVQLDRLLEQTSFDGDKSEPLRPYEQLLACLPPSSASLLPKPYRWLMTSADTPLKEYYPHTFTVDMNGKRWPWEAVVLLPFMDMNALVDASRNLVDTAQLTENEERRNQVGTTVLYRRGDTAVTVTTPLGDIVDCKTLAMDCAESKQLAFKGGTALSFRPERRKGAQIPFPGFPTLQEAPIKQLSLRRVGIDCFGFRSRYRTSVLSTVKELPPLPPAELLAPAFVGSTVYIRYPYLEEAFVTAVSDEKGVIRGKGAAMRYWTGSETEAWSWLVQHLSNLYRKGNGSTGFGGWHLPTSNTILSVRPLKAIETLENGRRVKVFAQTEVQVPITAALWSPTRPNREIAMLPTKLEKDPYRFEDEAFRMEVVERAAAAGAAIPEGGPALTTKANGSGPKSHPALHNARRAATKSEARLLFGNAYRQKKAKAFSSGGTTTVAMANTRNFCAHRLPPPALGAKSSHPIPALASLQRNRRNAAASVSRRVMTLSSPPPSRLKAVGAIAVASAVVLFSSASSAGATESVGVSQFQRVHMNPPFAQSFQVRGGFQEPWNHRDEANDATEDNFVPPVDFAHGTTTLSFIYQGGIIVAVDSRASMGNFVSSKTVQKVLPVNRQILGTMAGGAADCSFWIRKLQAEAKLHELNEGRAMSVARASRILANALYANRGLQLSIGTMIMGFDDHDADSKPSIYYVDNSGKRLEGTMFSVGSGSTFALGILDTELRHDMTDDEAIALGIKAIRSATFRDAHSGGYINVYHITREGGWKRVFREDVAALVSTTTATRNDN